MSYCYTFIVCLHVHVALVQRTEANEEEIVHLQSDTVMRPKPSSSWHSEYYSTISQLPLCLCTLIFIHYVIKLI